MTSKIKNAVTKAIHNLFGDDYAVYTAYTEQGFSEPCFIVEMFPLNVQSTNSFLDDETQTVRIRYVPKDISQDEFIDGMRVRCFDINFSMENYTLVTELVYNYTVKVRNESTYDKAEDLMLGGDL